MRHRQVFPLAGRQVALKCQPGHVQDGIHGGPDFVAHGRQERALRLIRRVGPNHRLLQLPRATRDRGFQVSPVLFKAMVGGPHLGQQVLLRAGLEASRQAVEELSCRGLDPRWQSQVQFQAVRSARRVLHPPCFHPLEELAGPARRGQPNAGLQAQPQAGGHAGLKPGQKPTQRVGPMRLADQLRDPRRHPHRLDLGPAERAGQRQDLVPGLGMSRGRPQRQRPQRSHGTYLTARQVTSSWAVPNRWTSVQATRTAGSFRMPG